MNKLSADEIEYQKYLAREKYIMDEISKKKFAQYKMAQMKEQEEKARKAEEEAKKALAEAEKKALQAEEELDNMKKTVALNLLDVLDDDTIAIKTGLSIEEVGQIRKGHKSQA